MDYLLIISLIVGALLGAGLTAAVLYAYSIPKRKTEQKKQAQEVSARLTHEFNQEKKEIAQKQTAENKQAKFSRQRLAKKIDDLTEQLRVRRIEIETLNYQVKDAEYALKQAQIDLKNVQDDRTSLQAEHQQLGLEYRNLRLRLDLVEAQSDDCQKQIAMFMQQLEQKTRTQDALIFATNQLRETLTRNKDLEKRLAYQEQAPKGVVGLGFQGIDGLEPVHAIRLFEAGIHSPTEMRKHSPQTIATIAGVSPEIATNWFGNGRSE